MTLSFESEMLFSRDLAQEAGRLILQTRSAGLLVERKQDGTPVTDADRASEELIRSRIQEVYPQDTVLGEEFGESKAGDRRWLVDPIDGTKSFAKDVPLYGVLIALEVDGRVVTGVIHLPALDETIYAAEGAGCFFNDTRCQVSAVDDLSEALVLTTDETAIPQYGREVGWNSLTQAAGTVRTWGDAYGYAMVATGRAEVMADPILSPWDIAPIYPIIREAGGVISSWDGEGDHRVSHCIATNQALADRVRKTLRV